MTPQEERNKRFDEKLPQMITDLIWAVTDGGQKIEPSRFLSYQDEPVHEFEVIKSHLTSEVNLTIEQVEKWTETAPKIQDMWTGDTIRIADLLSFLTTLKK